MRLISLVLFAIAGFLVYDIYFGHNGIQKYKEVEKQLEKEQLLTLRLQQKNQDIADQINDLMQGSIAVEELARSELGLIKPNERFYRVLATDEKIRSMNIY